MAAIQLVVEIDGPPSPFPPAEPAAASRICTASRHLHRHYRMRRKRRAARRRPPSGGPQFNVKTLARPETAASSRTAAPDAQSPRCSLQLLVREERKPVSSGHIRRVDLFS